MAGDEHQAQQIVADGFIDGGLESRNGRLPPALELVPELLVLPVEHRAAAQVVETPMFGGSHEPGARIVRDA